VERAAYVIAMSELNGGDEVGEAAWVGPNCTVINRVRVGAGAKIGIASAVLKDVPRGQTAFGNPARQKSDN